MTVEPPACVRRLADAPVFVLLYSSNATVFARLYIGEHKPSVTVDFRVRGCAEAGATPEALRVLCLVLIFFGRNEKPERAEAGAKQGLASALPVTRFVCCSSVAAVAFSVALRQRACECFACYTFLFWFPSTKSTNNDTSTKVQILTLEKLAAGCDAGSTVEAICCFTGTKVQTLTLVQKYKY